MMPGISRHLPKRRIHLPVMATEAAVPIRLLRGSVALAAAWCLLALAGCGTPNQPNIALRKQNQLLTDQVAQLTRQHNGDAASLVAAQHLNPATPQLPPAKLDQLFTVHGLTLGRLTSGDNPDPHATVDSQLLVYAVPTDDDGDPIKVAGSFDVSAFDLADPAHPLVGHWNLSSAQTRGMFQSHLSLYTYVLACPWQMKPQHPPLTVRVSFHDELTGRVFNAERVVTVRP